MTVVETAIRRVDYLDAELRRYLPPEVPALWYAEESCERLAHRLDALDEQGRLYLAAAALDFLAGVLGAYRREILPPGDLEKSLFVDPEDRFELVGKAPGHKLRIDQGLRLALVRNKPIAIEGARLAALRQELRSVVCFPLGGLDRKPVVATRTVEPKDLEPTAIYAEFDAPSGMGFINGRFDLLRVYSDGKLLLVGPRPVVYRENAYEPEAPGGTAPENGLAGPVPEEEAIAISPDLV